MLAQLRNFHRWLRLSLRWMRWRLEDQFNRRAYVFLSVPFLSRHKIRERRSNTTRSYAVRDKADFSVLAQIYRAEQYSLEGLARGPELQRTYEAIVASGATPLIIDCGANIGAASNYFLDRFPRAKVIAIEPEAGNFAQLAVHCASPSIDCVNAAVASRSAKGRVVDPGRGRWGFRVEPEADGTLDFITINGLLADARYSAAMPFLIKIDIEGFEDDLFAANIEWVERFPLLIVELHDWLLPGRGTSRNFLKAVGALDRDFVPNGENNVVSIANAPKP